MSRQLHQYHQQRCSLQYGNSTDQRFRPRSWDAIDHQSTNDPWRVMHRRKMEQQQQQQRNSEELVKSPPRLMSESEASQLEARYRRKVRQQAKYQLVAAFVLNCGRIEAYHAYSAEFQLTERRRELLNRYYSRGRLAVALYLDQNQCEHYMPLITLTSVADEKSPSSASSTSSTRSAGSSRGSSGVSRLRSLLGLARSL